MERYVNQRLARHIRKYGFESDFSDHDDLTLETLLEFPMEDWDWSSVLFHPKCTLDWILAFKNKPWPWRDVHVTDNFSVFWILHIHDKPLDWTSLSRIENIHSIAVEYPDKPWDWRSLSVTVPIYHITQYPDLPWDWSTATIIGNITVQEMCRHPDLPWDIENLSFSCIGEDEIEYLMVFRHRFTEDQWVDFSRHAIWDFVKLNMGFPWVFEHVRFKKDLEESDFELIQTIGFNQFNWARLTQWVDCDVILKYNYYPWRWDVIHLNTTLGHDHLDRIYSMNWSQAPCEDEESIVLKWHSACVIQRQWRRCTTDPEFTVCRNQIYRFLDELENYLMNR